MNLKTPMHNPYTTYAQSMHSVNRLFFSYPEHELRVQFDRRRSVARATARLYAQSMHRKIEVMRDFVKPPFGSGI